MTVDALRAMLDRLAADGHGASYVYVDDGHALSPLVAGPVADTDGAPAVILDLTAGD